MSINVVYPEKPSVFTPGATLHVWMCMHSLQKSGVPSSYAYVYIHTFLQGVTNAIVSLALQSQPGVGDVLFFKPGACLVS